LEVTFQKFPLDLIAKMQGLVLDGLRDETFDICSSAAVCLDIFNDFLYSNLKKEPKDKLLGANVRAFYQNY